MIDFIEYVVSELKSKRISRHNALALMQQFAAKDGGTGASIHPLLHTNISDLSQQTYQSVFTGKEHFLADHKVKTSEDNFSAVLPGAAYLEMVQIAVQDALPDADGAYTVQLQNVVWAAPVVVTQKTEVLLTLIPEDADPCLCVDFEVYSVSEQGDETIHCQGQALLSELVEAPVISLDTINGRIKPQKESPETVYNLFRQLGLDYGRAHQPIESLQQGDDEVLAKLQLPESLLSSFDKFLLHPSLIDGALQTSVGLQGELVAENSKPSLPFALGKLTVYRACPANCYAWVRYAQGSGDNDALVKLDIDLVDESGQVCVALSEFTARVLSDSAASASQPDMLLAAPVWKAWQGVEQDENTSGLMTQWHLTGIQTGIQAKNSWALPENTTWFNIEHDEGPNAREFETQVQAVFAHCKKLLEDSASDGIKLQLLLPESLQHTGLAALNGLLLSVVAESPQSSMQVLQVSDNLSSQALITSMAELQQWGQSGLFHLTDNSGSKANAQISQQHWQAPSNANSGSSSGETIYKDNGVYVITGASGALGQVFINSILEQTQFATVAALGRSESASFMDDLATESQNRVFYYQADLNNQAKLKSLIGDISTRHGAICGVLHVAGMTDDNFLRNKTPEQISKVLAPKVAGTVNLDLATANEPLDFFAMFSSMVAVTGNTGQADYAAANGFMDRFASYRQGLCQNEQRQGKSLSVNWPYWQTGGMTIDEDTVEAMRQATGLMPMPAEKGVQALAECLKLEGAQQLVAWGESKRVLALLNHEPNQEANQEPKAPEVKPEPKQVAAVAAKAEPSAAVDVNSEEAIKSKTLAFLREQFSSLLKLPPHRIEPNAALENYGIDSVLAMSLTRLLEETFGSLSKTLFFEYQTIDALTQYFIKKHSDKLNELFGADSAAVASAEVSKTEQVEQTAKPLALDKGSEGSKVIKAPRKRGGSVKRRGSFSGAAVVTGASQPVSNEPIAIVGMSGRYPESPNLESFWQNLRDGKDCVIEVPESRWDWQQFYTEDRTIEGGHYSKWGGFIEGVDEFDPRFFNISPRDAVFMDPQERLFLQYSWHAIEDAGLTRDTLRVAHQGDSAGQVGVYAGVMYGEYNRSGSLATIANRVSYVMNLHGPSMTLDTMCSSSLTAIHLACEDLKQGRIDAALAGGVNVSAHPGKYTMLSAGQFISGDGHCQSFGEGGDGYIPGEGVGVVVLKRLVDAKQDGHHIYALVSGSALNHGGKTNGYTVPNPHAQAAVIRQALKNAGRSPDTVSYIEAHGTGTSLGDPIEITALDNAFEELANGAELPAGSCAIGSAKSNIGHCESAAGIAGVAKVILQLQHQQIVPSLHSSVLNPHINFDQTPFEVNQKLRPWQAKAGLPRVAGVSSFGAGGSNAHLVIEEYQAQAVQADVGLPQVVVPLSARTPAQLEQKVSDLLSFLDKRSNSENDENISLPSLGYTLQIGREPMDERVAFWVRDIEQLRQALAAFAKSPNEKSWDHAIFRDSIKGHKDTIGLLRDDRDFSVTLRNWLQQGKLEKVLEFWVKGLTPDWLQLYTEQQLAQLRRISLPSYPFARESYWMDLATTGPLAVKGIHGDKAIEQSGAVATQHNVAHPLLHENFSSVGRQRYRSHFAAEHPLMANEGVSGQLAPATLLAMALAAADKASDETIGQKLLQLQDMAFGAPYGHQAGKLELEMVAIAGLSDAKSYNLAFDIFSNGSFAGAEGSANETIHAQGLFQVVTGGLVNVAAYTQHNPRAVNVAPSSPWQNVTVDQSCLQAQFVAQDDLPELVLPERLLNSAFALLTSVIAPQQAYGLQQIAQGDFYQSLDKVASVQWIAPSGYFDTLLQTGSVSGLLSNGEFELRLLDANGQVCAALSGVGFIPAQAAQAASSATVAACPITSRANVVEGVKVEAVKVAQGPVLTKPANIQLVGLQQVSTAAIAARPVTKLTSSSGVAASVAASAAASASISTVSSTVSSTATQQASPVAVNISDNVNTSVSTPALGSTQTLPQVASTLTVSLAQALFLEPDEIDPDTSFIDLGLDSIIGVEWVKDINKTFGTDISATRVYDFSTINALAVFVYEQLPQIDSDAAAPAQPESAPAALAPAPKSNIEIDLPLELQQELQDEPAPISIAPQVPSESNMQSNVTVAVTPLEVETKLTQSLAQALFLDVSDIEGDASFIDLGLDSIIGVEWVNSINKQFNLNISATRVYDYANLNELTKYVVSELEKVAPASAAVSAPAPAPASIIVEPPVAPVAPKVQSAGTPAEVSAKLTESLAQALFLDIADIEDDASFIDLGLDSIIGVEWVNSINKLFNLNISATRVYDYANLNELTKYVLSELEKMAPAVSAVPAAPAAQAAPADPMLVPEPVATVSQTNLAQVVYPKLVRRLTVGESSRLPVVSQSAHQPQVNDLIAVVGMSGRYPDAADLNSYWDNIIAGKNSVIEIPKSRWDVERYYDPDPTKPGKVYAKWLGMLQDAEMFDPLFFQIPPSEARSMDPQHRLFMQEGYHAFEDAGYSAESLSETRCGVYVGIMSSEYAILLAKDPSLSIDTTANSFAIGSARIAYYLNLKGPAIPIDTACSSSLVAMHLARQALQNNEIDMALAGGVSLYLTAESYLGMCQAGMLSAVGQCKAFDNSADGFVPGEGVGAVVLKRLSDAQNDGDNIYGVIRASGINQDGKTNGITAPSVNSQIALERELYNRYEIDPESINYVETHGTGTKLGDPIELEALGTVYGEKTTRKNFCALGSVKSNLGHTSGAAGVASVHKVLLSMQNEQMCPTLHVKQENQFFNFANSPFFINKEARPWPQPEKGSRRAAVSSFGFSGTNAHLVLEQYVPQPQAATPLIGPVLIPISARTEGQLQQVVEQLLGYLDTHSDVSLHNLAFTLQVGRTGLSERLMLIVSSLEQLKQKLNAWLGGESLVELWRDKVTRDKQTLSLFNQDPEFRAKVATWLAGADYHNIAQYWVQGLQLDWQQLKRPAKLQRISLPGYPFAKQRFWVDLPEHSDVTAPVSASVAAPVASSEIVTEPATAQIFVPHWQEGSLAPVAAKDDSASSSEVKLLTIDAPKGLSGLPESQAISAAQITSTEKASAFVEDILNQQVKQLQVLYFNSDSDADFIPVLPLFYLSQALQQAKFKGKVAILAVNTEQSSFAQSAWQALSGFGKSLAMENPAYRLKTLSLDASLLAHDKFAETLLAELQFGSDSHSEIRYQLKDAKSSEKAPSIERSYQSYVAVAERLQHTAPLPFKQGGTYLITGGLGGLGLVMARYLIEGYQAKLVLSGRSANNESVQQKLQQLFIDSDSSDIGYDEKVLYVSADVTDAKQVQQLVGQAKEKFASIDGVLHCAGFNQDAFVLHKSDTQFNQVLAPKVQGTINLDNALADEQLDLFILFSSVAGAMGNPGQCDYAYANRFMDAFAQQRQLQCDNGSRWGQNLSVNWPLWRDGGMTISDSDVEITKSRTGMEPLPNDAGLQSLGALLCTGYRNALVLFGQTSKIKQYVLGKASTANAAVQSNEQHLDQLDEQQLLSATVTLLSDIISSELKISPEDFDSQERFENYGIDSIVIGRLNLTLENALGELSKTLFYEYETTEELAEYLAQNMGESLQALLAEKLGNERQGVQATVAASQDTAQLSKPSVSHASAVTVSTKPVVDANEGIAIVGIHGYFPQSDSIDDYWHNLKSGKDLIETVPESRWSQEALFDADPMRAEKGKIYCKWGSFVDNFDKFDAEFFSIHPAEAAVMDPQERLFLQSVWSAVEDAGYTRQTLQQNYASAPFGSAKTAGAEVGVFVGVTSNTYQLLAPQQSAKGNSITPSSMPWSIANRVSYFFDFAGPSMPVDTSCSSSLVAVHMACESLRSGDCQVAVAGGVNLYLHPAKYQSMCTRAMLAQHGKNRSFGAGDNGFVPGEGVGSMILKPVSQAVKDGDNIYGVVSGSACTHSGRSNGYSAPNPHSQAKVIFEALQSSGVTGADIGYVEGHGTGTQLGDNLEVVALKQAFGQGSGGNNTPAQSCALGSVKANMGHAESAAGVAGIIKLLMQIKHKHIVPGLHANPVNPDIDFNNSPFYLSDSLHQWHVPKDTPRRGLINGFGAGGVNAAVVIEQFLPQLHSQPYSQQEQQPSETQAQPLLFPVSAKSEGQLRRYVQLLLSRIQGKDAPTPVSLAYTLQTGREAMTWRLAVLATDIDQLRQGLLQWLRKQDSTQCFMGAIPTDKLRSKAYRQQLQEETQAAMQNRDLSALAALWLKGAEPQWSGLYQSKQQKVSLPTYPFDAQRHWVEVESETIAAPTTASGPARLHPLLSYNASTLKTVSFISELDSNAFYATEHKVNEACILPGTAYLEIANIAGTVAGEQKVRRLSDLVWAMPFVFGDGVSEGLAQGDESAPQLQTFLKTIGDATEFEVTSVDGLSGRQMHCEGRLYFDDSILAHRTDESELHNVDPKLLLQTMSQQGATTLNHQQLYQQFAQTGLQYGEAFSTIQQLHSCADKAVARWQLPASLLSDFTEYLLHPAILDGVLQSIVGIGNDDSGSGPYLPFAIGQLDILRPLSMSGYTIVEQVPQRRGANGIKSDIIKFNITVTDDVGQVLLSIVDFCVRALPASTALTATTDNQVG